MTQYKWIDANALKLLHEESLALHGGGRGVRDLGLFESAMMRPQNLLHYNEDVDLARLAASYAYGLANNHPFVDGNKRAAFLSIGVFLGINGYKLTATQVGAIQTILKVASGELEEEGLASWIRENITTIS